MCVNNYSGQFIYSDLYKRCVQFCMIITPNIASFVFKVTKYILSRKISSHMIFFDQIFSRITFPHILAAPPAQNWEYPNLHFFHPSTITNPKSAVSLILINFQLILVNFQLILVKLQGVQLLLWVVTCTVITVHAVDRPGIAQFEGEIKVWSSVKPPCTRTARSTSSFRAGWARWYWTGRLRYRPESWFNFIIHPCTPPPTLGRSSCWRHSPT